jgi:hypothetical protein
MTTSVCRNWASQNLSALEEKAQGTIKRAAQSRSAAIAIAALPRSFSPQAITVNEALTPDVHLQRSSFTGSTILWC